MVESTKGFCQRKEKGFFFASDRNRIMPTREREGERKRKKENFLFFSAFCCLYAKKIKVQDVKKQECMKILCAMEMMECKRNKKKMCDGIFFSSEKCFTSASPCPSPPSRPLTLTPRPPRGQRQEEARREDNMQSGQDHIILDFKVFSLLFLYRFKMYG